MSRLLRLKCPACQTLIETLVEDELRVTLQCAACREQFTAHIEPRPVAAQPVASRPAAPRPVASRPVPARPAPVQPRLFEPAPVDPLFDLPTGANIPLSPAAYKPVRKREPLNLRPLLALGGGVLGVLLAVFLCLYIWHWAANTDWTTFSLMPDSHEKLVDEWFERRERDATENAKQMGEPNISIEQGKQRIAEMAAWSESMFVRVVRLGKAPLDKQPAFKERQDALDKKARSLMEAKLAELKASGAAASKNPDLSELMRQNPVLMDGVKIAFALPGYMSFAFFDLPAPANEVEKIYYQEADLVHDYLKKLTMVRNTSQSIAAAEKIQEMADKMMELAIKRSKMQANRFEQVPREYVSKDRALGAAQKALVVRILRDAKPDEKLKDAVSNFNDARDLLMEAANGRSDITLRSRFADARKLRAQTTQHGPGDLFYIDPPDPAERDLVVKPSREMQPEPMREPPPVEIRPQPAPETIVSHSPAANDAARGPGRVNSGAASGGAAASPPVAAVAPKPMDPSMNSDPPKADTRAPTTPSPTTPSPTTPSPTTPSPYSPSMRDHFMRGMQDGMQPGVGPPVDGQARVFPSQGFGAPPPGSTMPVPGMPGPTFPPPLDKAESVTVIIINAKKLDGGELVKRLAAKLESAHYSHNSSNGKIKLQIKYVGELSRVAKLIDFGKVTLIDSPERSIHVTGE